ncbi:MAG: FAD-dependent oxidoreductase [Candidatus Aenigmarchaeota archaeon]|nr:FAD-dependent oxidoreductase [Candidatus Aenigmarchaeota archaeon]
MVVDVMYDVIIIGGAAAGLTAGIYAARRKLKTLILTKDIGGQASLAFQVENYPGFLKIPGFELMQKFYQQAINSGAKVILEEVKEIKEKNSNYLVKTEKKEYETKTVILAFGKTPRSLNVPGEKEFIGKGVSYCAICDLPLFKNKIIAVVGGGNSALDATLNGSDIASKVYLIHRRKEFRGFEELVEKVKNKSNVELVLDSVVKEIKGKKFVESIIVKNVLTEEEREIKVDGVFVEIGFETNLELVKDLVKIENNQVVINKKCETFYPNSDRIRPGIFAAGDLTDTPFKQIITAAAEGAKAALQAYNYIKGIDLPITIDWRH